jgi:hypothetical protein
MKQLYLVIYLVNEDKTKSLMHIMDVRDWILSLYEDKCAPVLHKLSTLIPELCPHYLRFYKAMLEECDLKMYQFLFSLFLAIYF